MPALQHPAIGQVAALTFANGSGDRQLAACLVPSGDVMPSRRQLRNHLANRLPSFMIPTIFRQLPELPMTTNGELDRRRLAELVEASRS